MKIEYLETGSSDCPLIRIFGDDSVGANNLYEALMQLARNEVKEVRIHDLPGISPVEGCNLLARIGDVNTGINITSMANVFECILTNESWLQVAELIQPFCSSLDGNRHQWLDETSDISLLVTNSVNGEW
jgi:hypothetical protein